jgi:hypothetical protein
MRGVWLDDPVLFLLPGTRDVELPVDLRYVDRRGQLHVAPKASRSDGMTSPAWSWGIIGSPLTPEYRRPCFIHDVQVRTKSVPWREAHLLLCEMLEEARDGRLWRWRVALFRALLLRWGPRW